MFLGKFTLGFVLAQMVKNKSSQIETFETGTYVIEPSDHENDVQNFIGVEGTRILEIFVKK